MSDLKPRFKPRDLVAEALASLTARPGRAVLTALGTVMGVAAASPGRSKAVRAELSAGRLPDAGHSARADRVAVVGANIAEQLHVTRLADQPAIFLGERLYTVVGVISATARQSSLLGSVVI